MPLWTTYLSNWSRHKEEILKAIEATSPRKVALPKFVMRNRGNNEVAPSFALLTAYKAGTIMWKEYEKQYRELLTGDLADEWVFDVAQELKDGTHIILICFEKNPTHCHRRLLAEWIKNYDPEVDYRGEISLADKKRPE
jgi:uncharacterized protein YeaO (DUF488 family)